MRLIVAFLLLLSSNAIASESYIRYGVGLSSKPGAGETKLFGLGYSDRLCPNMPVAHFLSYQFEGGGWTDSGKGEGRKPSLYGSAQLGMDLHAGVFRAASFHGLGAISSPDTALGSVPQFFHDISLGLQDDISRASISISYKHISNAGLFSDINRGRDFMTVKLSVPW